METSNECRVCGDSIDGKKAARVILGTMKRPPRKRTGPGKFEGDEDWGEICMKCFVIQLGDENAIDFLAAS